MLWGAHILFSLGVVSFFTIDPIVLTLAGFLAVVPDLDKPFHHRAWFSHSIYAAIIFSVVGFVASNYNVSYAIVVFLAISSHVVLDFITKSGVPILHPWKKKHYGLRAVKAHDKASNRAFMVLGAMMLAYNFWVAYPVL
jgi:membrane-bound metal-dependent hydrolase YbcI (DUF457 family)